jgi:hypothetical protein
MNEHKYAQTVTEPLSFVKTVGIFKLRQEHNLHRCHVHNGMGTYCSYHTMDKHHLGITANDHRFCLPGHKAMVYASRRECWT